MNWSMQLYSARNFQPWARVLQVLAQAGYREVEGYDDVYADLASMRAELDRNGLAMPTGHFSLDALETGFDDARRIADALGIRTMICPYLEPEKRPAPTAAGWRGFGERLAAVSERLRKAGYGFAWHNHDYEFAPLADGSVPFDHVLAAAPALGWEMDVAWMVRCGADPLPWIDRYGANIVGVHVKDIARPGEGADEDGWSDVGHGTMDWAGLLKVLRGKTAARHYVMEQDNPNDFDRFARRSIASVQGY
jgi:sugar phosphate isomerase/epimerase